MIILFFTSIPALFLQKILEMNGHELKGFAVERVAPTAFQVKIDKLSLLDQNKTFNLEEFVLEIQIDDFSNLATSKVTLAAKTISFRDETKPSVSLNKVLENLSQHQPGQESDKKTCLHSLQIENLSFAVSHSADAIELKKLRLEKPCFQQGQKGAELSYLELKFESTQVQKTDSHLEIRLNQNHFDDLLTEKLVRFPLQSNLLLLVPTLHSVGE